MNADPRGDTCGTAPEVREDRSLGSRVARALRGRSLALKLALLIVSVSFMGVTASFLLGATVHRGQLVDAARESAERLSLTIRAALEDAMIRNDRSLMAGIMGKMGEYGVVSRAWLLDAEDRVYVSTVPGEVGSPWQEPEGFSGPVQAAGAAEDPAPLAVLTGRDTLVSSQPLRNDPACRQCHEADRAVLGRLVLELPMNDLQGQLAASLRPMAAATLTALALLIVLLVAGVHRLVVRPVQELGSATARLAAGDLDRPVSLISGGEFTRLARAFDQMRRSLKGTLAEKDRRNKELRALNRLALAAAESSSPGAIARLGLDVLQDGLEVEAGAILLACWPELALAASIGLAEEQRIGLERMVRRSSALAHARREGAVVRRGGAGVRQEGRPGGPRDASLERYPLLEALRGASSGVYVCLPLVSRNVGVGVLEMVGSEAALASPERRGFLNLLAHELGVAIHNLNLLSRTREIAILEERDRVAREMHDRLAQALAYVRLQASLAEERARNSGTDDVAEGLREIGTVAGAAYAETREAIFHLRASTRGGEVGLVRTLQVFAGDCARRYNLDVVVEACDGWEIRALSSDTETQLLLAVQEAVFNACRHARARSVVIRVERRSELIRVRVIDDGSGFDAASRASHDGYGLRIMRERVEGVGGRMELHSAPGKGTQVQFELPG